MSKDFANEGSIEVDATPDEIWQAIATGPGIDSWFMGRNEVDPDAGTVRQFFGGYEPEHRITAWEPAHRLAYRDDPAPDGRFVAFEFLIEGRDQAGTVLRIVNSGFLPGDDWETEYEAMIAGSDLFFTTLATYLRHFVGRTAVPVTVFGPMITDWPATRATLLEALGLSGTPTPGDPVRVELAGPGRIDGEVYLSNEQTLGVRTADGFYRFMKGFGGPIIAGHQLFDRTDPDAAHRVWQTWLDTTFSGRK